MAGKARITVEQVKAFTFEGRMAAAEWIQSGKSVDALAYAEKNLARFLECQAVKPRPEHLADLRRIYLESFRGFAGC